MQFLSKTGLAYFTNKIKTLMETKVDKIEGKGLSTNDYTTAEKTKLSGIEEGANKTIIDSDLNESSTNPVENRVVVSYLNQAINIAIEQAGINTDNAVSGINSSLDNKQDKLTAGTNITIVDNVISATASGGSGNESITDGRNLILDADFSELANNGLYSFDNGEVTFDSSRIATESVNTSDTRFKIYISDYGMAAMRNKTVTFSMEYMAPEELGLDGTSLWVGAQIKLTRNTTTGGSSQTIKWYGSNTFPTAATTDWVKYSITFDVTDYDIASNNILIICSGISGVLKFRNPKLEIGSKSTPWSLAPEDIESDLKSLKDRLTALEASM